MTRARSGLGVRTGAVVLIGLVCGPAEPCSFGEPTDAEGQLIVYERHSPNSTAARRRFEDAEGKLLRETFYRGGVMPEVAPGRFSAYLECSKDNLHAYRTIVYRYDEQGREIGTTGFDGEGRLTATTVRSYQPDGRQVTDAFAADGVLRSRTIAPQDSRNTVFTFDDAGNSVIAIHGPLVEGLDLPHGWGDAFQGISCGAAASGSEVTIGKITVYATLRNLSSHSIKAPVGHHYWVTDLELRDSAGNTVAKNTQFIEAEMNRLRRLNRRDSLAAGYRPLPPEEATYWGGRIDLGDWYADVPAGRYQLIVVRHLDEPKHDMVCNPISLLIGSEEDP